MNGTKKDFWELKMSQRELIELALLILLTVTAIFLLRSSFDRAAAHTTINVSKLETATICYEKI